MIDEQENQRDGGSGEEPSDDLREPDTGCGSEPSEDADTDRWSPPVPAGGRHGNTPGILNAPERYDNPWDKVKK
jgi:hypothetical protein